MNPQNNLPKRIKVIFTILILITLASLTSTGMMFMKLRNASPEALAANNDAEIKGIVAAVGKLIVLPTNETPTLATVSDPSKLKDQPFFAQAQTGDKVLVYSVSRKAILWRPSISKIIEVSTLNVNSPAAK